LGEQAQRPATRTAPTALIFFMLITIGNTGIEINYSRPREESHGPGGSPFLPAVPFRIS
jgi:hypothetical protein